MRPQISLAAPMWRSNHRQRSSMWRAGLASLPAAQRGSRGIGSQLSHSGARGNCEGPVRRESTHHRCAECKFPLHHHMVRRERAGNRGNDPQQSGRRSRSGRCFIRRLQSRRAPDRDLGRLDGSASSDDGLRHPPRAHVYVPQAETSLCLRLWLELHNIQVLKP